MSAKIFLSLCMLLGLALPALSHLCPDHERLPPTCDCEDEFLEEGVEVELSCSGSNLVELRDALNLMDKSARLEVQLDEMILDPLPSDIFDGLNVVKLDISHCELDALSYKGQLPFSGLEDKLEGLVIASSFTEENEYTKLDLSHLNRLRELDLSYNSITDLNDDWFANGPATLTHLTMSNNGIDKMGDNAFSNLVNLKELALHGNRFGNIKRSMLPKSADKLDVLDLQNNDLTSVPNDLFTGMPALKELLLTTNNIRHLQEQAFKPIWAQLNILDVRGNPVECDSNIEWAFGVSTEAAVFGECHGPSNREGQDLWGFIKNKGAVTDNLFRSRIL